MREDGGCKVSPAYTNHISLLSCSVSSIGLGKSLPQLYGSVVIGDVAADVVIPPTTTIGKKINVINFAKDKNYSQ